MSAKSSDKKRGRTRAVVSVSITPEKTDEFYAALATLKRHHEDPFIQAAPLIVETIIEAARRIQQEAEQIEEVRAHDGRELSHPNPGHEQSRESR